MIFYPIRNFKLVNRMNKSYFESISSLRKAQIRIKILQVITYANKLESVVYILNIKMPFVHSNVQMQPHYSYILCKVCIYFKIRKLFAEVIQMENAKLFANYIPKGNFYFTSFTLTCEKRQQQTKY